MNSIFTALVDHFGDQIKTAERLRVDQSTVSGWVRGRHGMGPLTALRAEKETGGLFKAADLCPDIGDIAKPAA